MSSARASQMYEVSADQERNLLRLVAKGSIPVEEARALLDELMSASDQLKPGFDVISDYRDCTMGALRGSFSMIMGMRYLKNRGVRQVVRLTKQTSVAHRQILAITAKLAGYAVAYVETMDEAEAILANLDAQSEELPQTGS